MEDISGYSLDAIYEMIRNGTISVTDLANYISEVVPNLEASEEVLEFLEEANRYIDDRIRSGIEVSEPVVEESHVETEPSETSISPNISTDNDELSISQEQSEEVPSSPPSQEQSEEAPVVEETTEEIPPTIETSEVVNSEYPYYESDGNSYEEARQSMNEAYHYCQTAGMTINDISLAGKNGRGPYITFEINNESKQFLNHLMSEFYQNTDGVSLEFMRDVSTRSEFFTIEVDSADMSQEEFYLYVKETFDKIYHTVEMTKKDFDYENTMPNGLKNIKEHFRNDDPDIGQDFTIGYVRNDGKDTYYIVADDNISAVQYAQSIGYDIKNSQGANIFEIDTKTSSVIDTKMTEAAVDLSSAAEALDISQNGVSNLDIYGSLDTNPQVAMIENFIETSNDPHIMCVLDVVIPPDNTSQRIVKLKSENSGNNVVVFTDGDDFDKNVMPKIVDTYAENNPTTRENATISGGSIPGTYSCQIDSENNTTLMVDGYSENEVNKMVDDIDSKTKSLTAGRELENNNVKQKRMGTYSNNSLNNNSTNNSSTAFVSMPVLFVICILFILMISLIIFAG